jgi:hypothetical protein
MREINEMLSQPAAVPLVATIVHEATHQIAFNCGLQQRYADIPLWLCEGMAVYFEAPDLTSTRGWRGIGRVNYPRLETFRKNVPNWREEQIAWIGPVVAVEHRVDLLRVGSERDRGGGEGKGCLTRELASPRGERIPGIPLYEAAG